MEAQNKKFSELVEALEHISEDQYGMLVGGFATMMKIEEGMNTYCTKDGPANTNCEGGNCTPGCGQTQY